MPGAPYRRLDVRAARPATTKTTQIINGRPVIFEVFVGGEERAFDTPEQHDQFDRVQRELLEADRALDEAMERKRAARDAWLELIGHDIGAVQDPERQKRIVTFVNAPKVDKDVLHSRLSEQNATDIWNKSVTQETAVTLRFRFDARRSVDQLLRGLNRYAAQYKGYVDFDSVVHDSVVDLDTMTLLCQRRPISFPEEAFSDRYGVRVYPLDNPSPDQSPG